MGKRRGQHGNLKGNPFRIGSGSGHRHHQWAGIELGVFERNTGLFRGVLRFRKYIDHAARNEGHIHQAGLFEFLQEG